MTAFPEPVAWATPHKCRPWLAYALDQGGDEFFQIYLHDLRSGARFPITHGRAHNEGTRWSNTGRYLALSSDARNGKDMDLYIINPQNRKSWRRLSEQPGWWTASSWSPDDRRLAAVENRLARDDSRVHLFEVETGKDELVFEPPADRPVRTDHVRWARDGSALYWLSDLDSEFRRLVRYDFATRSTPPLTASIPWDIEDFEIAGDGRSIVLVANEDGYSRLHLLDGPTGRFHVPPTLAKGQISQIIFRSESQEFCFEWSCTQAPQGIYSFDLGTAVRTEWVRPTRDNPVRGPDDEPELIRYPSFDGRPIPAFVRRPAASPFRRPPYPVLIDLHGGPSAQSRPTYSSLKFMLLHDLGIALIAPNVPGSTGYGRTYESLDDGPRREDAVKDIGALLDWIATQPELDKNRVAVSGSSFGGYMVLASLVQYGDRLRAGIDFAGFSSFETLLRNAEPYGVDAWRREDGDERDPKTAERLHALSPLSHADRIRRPLLVIHGRNDPRVKLSEAVRIASAVRKNGVPVWSLLLHDEGHGVARREHAYYVDCVKVLFLKEHLTPIRALSQARSEAARGDMVGREVPR